MKQLIIYTKLNNQKPFENWVNGLDNTLQERVDHKIVQLTNGNFNNCSILKNADGVKEARIRTSSGLRIYFTEENNQIIILLVGGDKDTQKRDIEKAKEYWQDYKQRR